MLMDLYIMTLVLMRYNPYAYATTTWVSSSGNQYPCGPIPTYDIHMNKSKKNSAYSSSSSNTQNHWQNALGRTYKNG